MGIYLGVVGRGYWGNTWCGVLRDLGVNHFQAGREWTAHDKPDGLIIASSSASHYEVAVKALARGIPILVEKPVSLTASEARNLVSLGGIAYAGHTRLYDPFWPEFKASVGVPLHVEAWAGGVNETNPDAELNWWVHLAAMCWDLGFDPMKAVFHVTTEKQPLRFVADGKEFTDSRGGLANLARKFIEAIERGEPDNAGLRLGVKTLEFVEKMNESKQLHRDPRHPCGLAA